MPGFAALYYWIMRRVVGMTEMPARGADFFLIDRLAIDAFRRCDERNVSVLALVTWLGFRQADIEYHKQPRAAGRSGWTLARKVALVVDSVTAFTALPMRVCGAAGCGPGGAGPGGCRLWPRDPRRRSGARGRRVDHRASRRATRGPGGDGRILVARTRRRAAAARRISWSAWWA